MELPPNPEFAGPVEVLREELDLVSADLKEHLASWPYAYAMAGGCHGGSEHPALRAVRDEVARLRTRKSDLESIIAEITHTQ